MSATGLQYDEEWSRRIESIYTTLDVVAQRQAVLDALELRSAERVLDVGSGPGLLAYDMGIAVGQGGVVKGIDISESMVALSQRRCADLPWVEIRTADATALPYSDGEFDAAASLQVYEYVHDVSIPLKELHRVLRPGGGAGGLQGLGAPVLWLSDKSPTSWV